MDTDRARLARAVDATVLAELVFQRPDGVVDAAVVTPLVTPSGGAVVALPFASRELADTLGDATSVAMTLSDARMALHGWEALALIGHVEVEADVDGRRFETDLLEQELRKHPPSRLLADSLRDRRDHWWFLPRLLCHLRVDEAHPLTARREPTTGVLAWPGGRGLRVETVEVADADEQSTSVRPLGPPELPERADGTMLLRHDYSQPDLERRCERRERGRLRAGVLVEVERTGQLVLPDPPRLLDRVRRHRALSRACRRELARAR